MTAAEMIQNYAEVRARLMGRPQREAPTIIALLPPPIDPKPYEHIPRQRDWINVSDNIEYVSQFRNSREILEAASKRYNVSIPEIKGTRRDKAFVKARHECCYRLSKELGYTLVQIGRILGNRDHTSVLSGIRRHELRLRDPGIDDRPTRGR